MKKAIIFGITGQDGSYLSELLIGKGYEIHGVIRRSSSFNTQRIHHLFSDKKIYNKKLFLHYGDLTDSISVDDLIKIVNPDEIYNLGAQSHVKVSFEIPAYTANVDAIGTLSLLNAIKRNNKDIKFYQASTSELYGNTPISPQDENTPFEPRSPYAIAKLYAYWIVKNYREAYNIFASNGILFNHESPRRGETFVTRKITMGVARIKLGLQENLELGNLYSKRDWGYAPEYVEAMWKILQNKSPDDFVIATGNTNTVKDFVNYSFSYLDIEIEWENKGIKEIAVEKKSGKTLVKINKNFFRPTEVDLLMGNPSKARNEISWSSKTKLSKLVKLMVDSDYQLIKNATK